MRKSFNRLINQMPGVSVRGLCVFECDCVCMYLMNTSVCVSVIYLCLPIRQEDISHAFTHAVECFRAAANNYFYCLLICRFFI